MNAERQPRPEDPLHLEPQLQVKRLNRLAVLLAAGVGIVVLWVAYFVLASRTPLSQRPNNAPAPSAVRERDAIDRLARKAAQDGSLPWSQPEQLAEPQATVSGTPDLPPAPQPDLRPLRAFGADVLLSAFQGSQAQPISPSTPELAARLTEAQLQNLDLESSDILSEAEGQNGETREDRYEAFVRAAHERPPSQARLASLRPPVSEYILQEGTHIPAILTTGIHSDLPGQTTALVRRNVYDSATGRHLLVPRGSRLIGKYDHRVAWGQKRVLLAWHRLHLPSGSSLDLDALPGADLAAMAGLRDKVDNHFVRTFGSALLLSAVTAGAQLSQPQEAADGGAPSARQLVAGALGQELGRVTTEITRRNVERQPSLRIRPGYLFHVEVTADLVFSQPYIEGFTGR